LDVVRADRFGQRAEVGRVVDNGNNDEAFHGAKSLGPDRRLLL
jgi:hypothetical protein